MNAESYLLRHGWTPGTSLHPHKSHSLKKPLLISRKVDVLGVGVNKHTSVSDQWWLRAFDSSLKALGTGRKGALDGVREHGARRGGLYGRFVRGETIEGTIGTRGYRTAAARTAAPSRGTTSAGSSSSEAMSKPKSWSMEPKKRTQKADSPERLARLERRRKLKEAARALKAKQAAEIEAIKSDLAKRRKERGDPPLPPGSPAALRAAVTEQNMRNYAAKRRVPLEVMRKKREAFDEAYAAKAKGMILTRKAHKVGMTAEEFEALPTQKLSVVRKRLRELDTLDEEKRARYKARAKEKGMRLETYYVARCTKNERAQKEADQEALEEEAYQRALEKEADQSALEEEADQGELEEEADQSALEEEADQEALEKGSEMSDGQTREDGVVTMMVDEDTPSYMADAPGDAQLPNKPISPISRAISRGKKVDLTMDEAKQILEGTDTSAWEGSNRKNVKSLSREAREERRIWMSAKRVVKKGPAGTRGKKPKMHMELAEQILAYSRNQRDGGDGKGRTGEEALISTLPPSYQGLDLPLLSIPGDRHGDITPRERKLALKAAKSLMGKAKKHAKTKSQTSFHQRGARGHHQG